MVMIPEWATLIILFVLGGGMTVGLNVLETKVAAKYAGILYSCPIMFFLAYASLPFSKPIPSLAETTHYSLTMLIASFIATTPILAAWGTLAITHRKWGPNARWYSLLFAFSTWLIIGILFATMYDRKYIRQ